MKKISILFVLAFMVLSCIDPFQSGKYRLTYTNGTNAGKTMGYLSISSNNVYLYRDESEGVSKGSTKISFDGIMGGILFTTNRGTVKFIGKLDSDSKIETSLKIVIDNNETGEKVMAAKI